MDSDRLALLRTIADNPADDFPRLVFADWLESDGREPGDAEHAELIRVQVEISSLIDRKVTLPGGEANLVRREDTARLLALRDREQELLSPDALRSGWLASHRVPFVMYTSRPPEIRWHATWDRGFVVEATMSAGWCRAGAAALCTRHPVQTIRLGNWDGIENSLPANPLESLPFLKRLELPEEAMRDFEGPNGTWLTPGSSVVGSRVIVKGFPIFPEVEVVFERRSMQVAEMAEALFRETGLLPGHVFGGDVVTR